MSLSAKTDLLEKDLARARGEIAKLKASAEESSRGVQAAFSQLDSSAGSIVKSLSGMAAGATAAVLSIGAMKAAVADLIKTGMQMESLRASFAAIGGGGAGGAKELQYVIDTANRLGVSITDTATAYKGLVAAAQGTSLAGEQTRKIFEAVTLAGKRLGLSGEDVKGTLLAVQQMMSKGTVAAEELRGQLGERLPGAFNIAARAMGVSTAALGKMLETGTILATDFLPKFANQLQKELGQGAQQGATTAAAAFARLENEWTLLKDRIAKSGPLTFVANLVGSAAALLTGGSKADAELTRRALAELGPAGNLATPQDIEQAKKYLGSVNDVSRNAVAQLRNSIMFGALEKRPATTAYDTGGETNAQIEQRNTALQQQLDAMVKTQADLKALNQQAPERLAVGTELAGRKVAQLNELLGKQREALQKVVEAANTGPSGGLSDEAQRGTGALQAAIRTTEAQLKGLEDAEEAKRKADAAAEAARRKQEQLAAQAAREHDAEEKRLAEARVAYLKQAQQEQERLYADAEALAKKYTTTQEERDSDRIKAIAAQLQDSPFAGRMAGLVPQVEQGESLQALMAKEHAAAEQRYQDWLRVRDGIKDSYDQLNRYEELLGMSQGKRIDPLARQSLKARADLAPALAAGGPEAERAQAVLRQMAPEFRKLQGVATEFADSFLSSIEQAASGGIKSFKQFADSVIMDLSRILMKTYATPFLSELLTKGIGLGLSFLGGTGGASVGASLGGGELAGTTTDASGIPGFIPRAAGGYVMPGRAYTVGEAGSELFVPREAGTIYPHGSGPGGGVTVHMTVVTQDAGSFKRSGGEVEAGLLAMLRRAQRNG